MNSLQNILCVRRATLEHRLGDIAHGLTTDPELLAAFRDIVRTSGEWRARPALEDDPTFLQIIVQALITNGTDVLALFRTPPERRRGETYIEKRNKQVALTAGGHVEFLEAGADDILAVALQRELSEEVTFAVSPAWDAIRPVGLICTATPAAPMFQRVHIGAVWRVVTAGDVRLPKGSDEFEKAEFVSPERLRALTPQMEEWAQLLAQAVIDGRLPLAEMRQAGPIRPLGPLGPATATPIVASPMP